MSCPRTAPAASATATPLAVTFTRATLAACTFRILQSSQRTLGTLGSAKEGDLATSFGRSEVWGVAASLASSSPPLPSSE